MNESQKTINVIKRMVKESNRDFKTISSYGGFIRAIAKNNPEILVKELESLNKKAAQAWERYANNPNVKDSSGYYYAIMEELVKPLNMTLDYPGLYVTYELTRKGRKFTEYTPLNAIRQFNNYWNHW